MLEFNSKVQAIKCLETNRENIFTRLWNLQKNYRYN